MVVNRLIEGDYFGEMGLLERLPRTATVKAETDTVLYRIDGQAFLDAVTQTPVISGGGRCCAQSGAAHHAKASPIRFVLAAVGADRHELTLRLSERRQEA